MGIKGKEIPNMAPKTLIVCPGTRCWDFKYIPPPKCPETYKNTKIKDGEIKSLIKTK